MIYASNMLYNTLLAFFNFVAIFVANNPKYIAIMKRIFGFMVLIAIACFSLNAS